MAHAGVILCDIPMEGWVYSCNFTPRGDRLIAGASDGSTRIFDVSPCVDAADAKTKQAVELGTEANFQGGRSWVMDVTTDMDYKFVCSAQRDGDVAVWKVPPDDFPFYVTDPAQLLRTDANRDDDDDEHPEPNGVAINWNGSLVCCPYNDGFLRIYKLGATQKPKKEEPEMTEQDVGALKMQKLMRGKKARKQSAIGSVLPSMVPPERRSLTSGDS